MPDTAELARNCYRAYVEKDRSAIERLVSDQFSFTSPYDDHIDRRAYFERCWANADRIRDIRIRKLVTDGDDAFVLYDVEPVGGGTFRNTEYLRFKDGRLTEVEVFFGEINGVERKGSDA